VQENMYSTACVFSVSYQWCYNWALLSLRWTRILYIIFPIS